MAQVAPFWPQWSVAATWQLLLASQQPVQLLGPHLLLQPVSPTSRAHTPVNRPRRMVRIAVMLVVLHAWARRFLMKSSKPKQFSPMKGIAHPGR